MEIFKIKSLQTNIIGNSGTHAISDLEIWADFKTKNHQFKPFFILETVHAQGQTT
jgi:hypothetical protein